MQEIQENICEMCNNKLNSNQLIIYETQFRGQYIICTYCYFSIISWRNFYNEDKIIKRDL